VPALKVLALKPVLKFWLHPESELRTIALTISSISKNVDEIFLARFGSTEHVAPASLADDRLNDWIHS
jgi:hypothetical protein